MAFYMTTFTITVVSENPVANLDLEDLAYEIEEGEAVGGPLLTKQEEITGQQAAVLLRSFGSTPDFFQLDANGNKVED